MRYTMVVAVILLAAGAALAQPVLPMFRPGVALSTLTINTVFCNATPTITGNGLTLYWTSNRPGTTGSYDIWTSTRPDLVTPWGPAQRVPGLSSPYKEGHIDVRDDDLEFVVCTHGKLLSLSLDIYLFSRTSTTVAWGGTVTPLTAANTNTDEVDPSMRGDGGELYFSQWGAKNPTLGGWCVYQTTRQGTNWSAPVQIPALVSTLFHNHSPAISSCGHYLAWSTDRPGGKGSSDYWLAVRPTLSSPFQIVQPGPLDGFNTIGWEWGGQWSGDGFSFYFAPHGAYQIWRADRILPLCLLGGSGVQQTGRLTYQIRPGTSATLSCRRDPALDYGLVAVALKSIPPTPLAGVQGLLAVDLSPGSLACMSPLKLLDNMGLNSTTFNVPINMPPITLYAQAAAWSASPWNGNHWFISERIDIQF